MRNDDHLKGIPVASRNKAINVDGATITPPVTLAMFEGALTCTSMWAGVTATDEGNPCTAWTATVTEIDIESGEREPVREPVRITHNTWLSTLRKIVKHKLLRDDVVTKIAAVLNATDNDSATDWVCQLDSYELDQVVQIAVFGEIVYC